MSKWIATVILTVVLFGLKATSFACMTRVFDDDVPTGCEDSQCSVNNCVSGSGGFLPPMQTHLFRPIVTPNERTQITVAHYRSPLLTTEEKNCSAIPGLCFSRFIVDQLSSRRRSQLRSNSIALRSR
jgi:hypothetical protein